jgi:hypothetical protein
MQQCRAARHCRARALGRPAHIEPAAPRAKTAFPPPRRSLQVGAEAAELRHGGIVVEDLSRQLRDWSDTAAYINNACGF